MRDSTKKLKFTHELHLLAVDLAEMTNDNKGREQAIIAANKAWTDYLEHLNPWLDI